MKYIRIFLLLTLTVMCCSAFTMKDKDKPVYIFGMAASFNDTVVYFTEVQLLDSVQLSKEGFLPLRDLYAYQLKNYVEYEIGKPYYTCMIYFSESKAKLEKEASKLKNRYQKTEDITLQAIAPEKFAFKKAEE